MKVAAGCAVRVHGFLYTRPPRWRDSVAFNRVFTTSNNGLGWDVGGGVMGFIGDHLGLSGDLRYVHAFKDLTVLGLTLSNAKLNYGRASVGVVLKF